MQSRSIHFNKTTVMKDDLILARYNMFQSSSLLCNVALIKHTTAYCTLYLYYRERNDNYSSFMLQNIKYIKK